MTIENDTQYQITKDWVERFQECLNQVEKHSMLAKIQHPLLAQAQKDALKSQIANLSEEIAAYENERQRH